MTNSNFSSTLLYPITSKSSYYFLRLLAHRSTARMIEEVAEGETDKIVVEVEVEDLEHLVRQKAVVDEPHQKEEYSFPIFLLK